MVVIVEVVVLWSRGVVEEEEDDEDDDIGRQVCAGQCMVGGGRHASVLLGKVPPTYLYDRLYYNRCPHLAGATGG
jgi:uncharacterized membrane protein YeiH